MLRHGFGIVCALGIVGCTESEPYDPYIRVDEACPETVEGENFMRQRGTEQMMRRISCYRQFVGLGPATVGEDVQAAAYAHALYLQENYILVPDTEHYFEGNVKELFEEFKTGMKHHTGLRVVDRLRYQDPTLKPLEIGVWDLFLSETDPERADVLMSIPWLRDIMFQPVWIGGGYAEVYGPDIRAGYFNIVYDIPPAERVDDPIVFPKNGQVDVPISWDARPLIASNPLAWQAEIGYPITIAVGSKQISSGENPNRLELLWRELIGPDGQELQTSIAEPRQYAWGPMRNTLVIAPRDPFEIGATYTLRAEIRWLAEKDQKTGKERWNQQVVESTFTTQGRQLTDVSPLFDTGTAQ